MFVNVKGLLYCGAVPISLPLSLLRHFFRFCVFFRSVLGSVTVLCVLLWPLTNLFITVLLLAQ